MSTGASRTRFPWTFFSLVFGLSVPFWIIGPIIERVLRSVIPINLPVSALMAFNPLIAASILAHRKRGASGVKDLLKRSLDYGRIKNNIWYLPIICLWPAMMVLAYQLMRLTGAPLPEDPQIPIALVPVLFVVFFISAAGENLGWHPFAVDPLQERWNSLIASTIVGAVWAVWHIVPFTQLNQTPTWILWQGLGMVPFRILMVWLYNNTGKSVFAVIVFQATANVSQFSFPNGGSHYDPFFAWLVLSAMAALVVLVWGPETLARYRNARVRGSYFER